jgi:hypothetical protein
VSALLIAPVEARRRAVIAAALGASLAAHAALLAGVPLALLWTAPESVPVPPLEARLVPAPPVARAMPQARKPAARSAPQVVPAAPAVLAAPKGDVSFPTTAIATAETEPPEAGSADTAPVSSAAAPAGPAPANGVARTLPPRGEISYVITLGEAVSRWEIGERDYRVETLAQTAGFAALFRPQTGAYVSTGRVTEAGLQPERFTASRTRSGRTSEATALFDWTAHDIEYGPPGAARHAPLAPLAQDIVSLAYHLAMLPLMPGRMDIALTNGWKIEHYAVEIGAEEPLETPVGVLRAIPVRQARTAGQRGLEIWLAPALHMLPVRIRMIDRDGGMAGEQVVSAVRIPQ